MLQSYVDNKGVHFRVLNRVGESQFDVLCKQINIEKMTYAFIPQKDLKQGLRDDLYIGLSSQKTNCTKWRKNDES